MGKRITLPKPVSSGKISLEEAIQKRRSERSFDSRQLTLEQISQILWAGCGLTDERSHLRAAPSAGALYPIELYLLKKEGLFHYLSESHTLERVSDQDLMFSLASAAFSQGCIHQAPVDIVIAAVYRRITSRYGQKGILYTHIEAGHIAQNIHLQAVALGLDSVPIGAFDDEEVKRTLALPKDHEPLYIIPVGYAK